MFESLKNALGFGPHKLDTKAADAAPVTRSPSPYLAAQGSVAKKGNLAGELRKQ